MKTIIQRLSGCFLLFLVSTIGLAETKPPNLTNIRVQLMGPAQAQFAGLYLAQTRNFFENHGLNVQLIPASLSTNPILELQNNKVDIAISWMSNVQIHNNQDNSAINIAQIFQSPSIRLICKIDRGIYQASDLKNKTIGIEGNGDQKFVEYLLDKNGVQNLRPKLVVGTDPNFLKKESLQDCITTTSYGSYLSLIKLDSNTNNLIEFLPEQVGIPNIEDGIYVLNKRLSNPEFEHALVQFLIALRQGWAEARKSPALAVEAVLQQNPNLSRSDQYYMLEQVLQLIPQDPSKFGLLDIKQFNQQPEIINGIWTHKIWDQINPQSISESVTTNATKYYMQLVTNNFYYELLIYFGVFTFALSGILEAVDRSYDLYGRLFLGLLSGLGGGTLRDLLIQGDRFPFYYIKDPTYPLGILLLVILTTLITALYPSIHKSDVFKNTKKYADVLGFSVLAMTGAVIALSSGLAWFWAPFFAALSCSGGGVLRDVIVNQEPSAFKKTIYEEPAVIGALMLIGGLYIAKQYEHSPTPVMICILMSISLVVIMRVAVYQFNLQYPKWLGGSEESKH